MITTVLLFAIAFQIHSPMVVYILLIIKAILECLSFGIKLGELIE